jgi:hypothetical protein
MGDRIFRSSKYYQRKPKLSAGQFEAELAGEVPKK